MSERENASTDRPPWSITLDPVVLSRLAALTSQMLVAEEDLVLREKLHGALYEGDVSLDVVWKDDEPFVMVTIGGCVVASCAVAVLLAGL